MKVTDPIADLLTRIRNAARVRKDMVRAPYSKLKQAVCDVLKKDGYIISAKAVGEGVNKEIVIELHNDRPKLHLKTMSRPGQRIYMKASEIPTVLEGLGLAIISTPKGVMSGRKAKKQNVGGEYICEVY
jgi:small subunit ribosomal protein S8